jgi:hypothetical protein
MIENHERRGLLRRHQRNPLHIAFGHYFVKAWDAREAAEMQLGRTIPTPKIVQLLRNTLGRPRRPPPPPQQALNAAAMMGASGGQQVPVQATLPPIQGSAAGMPAVGDMSTGSAGMSAGMYASKPMPPPQHTTAPHMGSVNAANSMMMDDAMTYSGYDNMGNNPFSASGGMQDAEMGGMMDWNYLVQLTSMGGFNPTGGYYVQGTGA